MLCFPIQKAYVKTIFLKMHLFRYCFEEGVMAYFMYFSTVTYPYREAAEKDESSSH